MLLTRCLSLALLAVLLGISSACSKAPAPSSLQLASLALFVYRLQPPALLEIGPDFAATGVERALSLPPGCQVDSLHPSPRMDLLAAELSCTHGPVTVIMDPRNGQLFPLLKDAGMDSHFLAWDRAGASLYLRVNAISDPRVLRMQVDARRGQSIPIDPYTYDLDSLPDGKHITFSFSRGLGFGSELWLSDANGRDPQRLLADENNIIGFARWSPDGSQLAFIRIPDSETPYTVGELWVTQADGSGLRKLADADAGHGFGASWSPDGRSLAFVQRSNPQDSAADRSLDALISNIAVVELESGSLRQVTGFERGYATQPVWSPAGNTLTFLYVLDGRMEIKIADLAGGTQATLEAAPVCCAVWLQR